GFEWIDANDSDNSVLTFVRRGEPSQSRPGQEPSGAGSGGGPGPQVLVACNFTPVPRHGYRVGLPLAGRWREILNSDAPIYGGSGLGNLGGVQGEPVAWHGRAQSALLTLPPLGVVMFVPEEAA
ncbi:MAG TPA: alpha amylase C-terminal domain-containing protein, partial [Gemmatimonadales bacterium]|nr:alpha amylase C-terminal domain-containing protein [Gemmatimonadales bacterium]